jgi:phenylpyruvate tautomerase PptA (4-oxalocrotonate tautomerase family)
MPSTRVEIVKDWLGTRRADFLEAVQHALVEGIRIPENDRDIRLIQYDPEDVLKAAGGSPRHTVIEIILFKGRTMEAKRRLYAALVARLALFDLAPSDIKVVLVEVDRENWGLHGQAASEIELGFKVDVWRASLLDALDPVAGILQQVEHTPVTDQMRGADDDQVLLIAGQHSPHGRHPGAVSRIDKAFHERLVEAAHFHQEQFA